MTRALPDTHQVVVCRGGDRTELEERPVPRPAEGEMLLRLRVVGLCGTDLFKLGAGNLEPGLVLGHELVGEVAALGTGVEAFSRGDRVAVAHHVPCGRCELCRRGSETLCAGFRENLLEPGGFADHVLVRPRACAHAARRVPDGVTDEAAVFMEPAACVMRGVTRAGAGAGGVAAVLGAGAMGLLHLLVLRALHPALRVVVVDPKAQRRELARALGASAAQDPGAGAAHAVEEISGGLGADVVFDTVGGARVLAQALALTREGGAVVLFAHAPDGERADFDLNRLFKHERRVLGTYSGGPAEQQAVFDLICRGALDPSPLASHRLTLDEFSHGVELVRRRQALKVLFTPSVRTRGGDGA